MWPIRAGLRCCPRDVQFLMNEGRIKNCFVWPFQVWVIRWILSFIVICFLKSSARNRECPFTFSHLVPKCTTYPLCEWFVLYGKAIRENKERKWKRFIVNTCESFSVLRFSFPIWRFLKPLWACRKLLTILYSYIFRL